MEWNVTQPFFKTRVVCVTHNIRIKHLAVQHPLLAETKYTSIPVAARTEKS
jgi:hypothetical protein